MSSQGTGTYDSSTGIWSVGVLPVGSSAGMELTLQVNNAGYFVNTATVVGDLHAAGVKSGLVKAFGVKAASTGNSQVSYTFTATNPGQTSGGNNSRYDFPPFTPLSNNPSNTGGSNSGNSGGSSSGSNSGNSGSSGGSRGVSGGNSGSGGSGGGAGPGGNGPSRNGPGGDNPGGSLTPANTQLARDIAGVRGAVTSGSAEGNIPDWDPDKCKPKVEKNETNYEVLFVLGVVTATVAVAYMKTHSPKFVKILRKLGIEYKNPPKTMKELFAWFSTELSITDWMEDTSDPLKYIFFVLSAFDLLEYISNEQIGTTIAAVGFGITVSGWIADYFGIDSNKVSPTERAPLSP